MNRLAKEQSIYLRHAANQKIEWYPWSEEVFEKARRENKPVFLSSGAAWCHWCHVMAKESFEDEAIAKLLNDLFICVKLDRDERPDIDRRFQQATAAMGSGTGWPLNVFLTPEKKVFFGGTYFPPRDHGQTPSFRKVLVAVSNFFKEKKADAESYAASVMSTLRQDSASPEELSEAVLDAAEKDILSGFDQRNGGFGDFPKFPMPGAIEFLLRRFDAGSREAGEAARKTLTAMERGGFHDQLGGGFHRYSIDEAWIVPHFEKMTDDNAGLLRNYIEAYSLFGDIRFREVAEEIIKFTGENLCDAEGGGFYASQDADVTPDDEGGYFTWTHSELRAALSPEEYEVIAHHLIHDRGEMQHDASKFVLAINQDPAEIAEKTGKSRETISNLIRNAKAALVKRRKLRSPPRIDRTIYTSLNGMMIAAYLRAFMVSGNVRIREFALKSLRRVMKERVRGTTVYHGPHVKGLLDDYVHLIDALIAAYESTGDRDHLNNAERLMNICAEKFLDGTGGGFLDTEEDLLGTRLKRIEDVPHSSANAVAIALLLKLAFMTGKDDYRTLAEQSMRIFSGPARTMGVHAGTYFCAVEAYYRRSTLLLETGPETPLAQAARAEAVRTYSPVAYSVDKGRVVPCSKGVCLEPIRRPNALPMRRP